MLAQFLALLLMALLRRRSRGRARLSRSRSAGPEAAWATRGRLIFSPPAGLEPRVAELGRRASGKNNLTKM